MYEYNIFYLVYLYVVLYLHATIINMYTSSFFLINISSAVFA